MANMRHLLEEINQLLSFARYGKSKLDLLGRQLQAQERNLRKIKSRDALKHFKKEAQIYQVRLMTTYDTIKAWQEKIVQLREQAGSAEGCSRRLRHKIKRLASLLHAQANRLTALNRRYQRLADNMAQKTHAMKPNIILGREPMATPVVVPAHER